MEPTALDAGWAALAAGKWAEAKELFESVLAGGESAEAREGLSWAAYCLDDEPLVFAALEEAFRLYKGTGDRASAGRVAAWLAVNSIDLRGEPAVANGWLRRAHSMLDDLEQGPDHGWLALLEADIRLVLDEDTATARELAVRGAELGREFGVPELEMVGLAIEGSALVSEGSIADGMRLLDEATASALTERTRLLVCVGWATCYLIAACEQVRDFERAGQWSLRVRDFAERHGISVFQGVCEAKYAGVLTWQGRWDEAESHLNKASEALSSKAVLIGEVLVRLAELRRLQGKLDEAERLFEQGEANAAALLGRAALALDRGQPDEAAELAERYLRRFTDPARIERSVALEMAVRAYAALGELDRAAEAVTQLRGIAARAATRPMNAAVLVAQATLDSARGDREEARRGFEDALDVLAGTPAPYDTAWVRVQLAAELEALGRRDAARRELESALAAFRRLGAQRAAASTEAMLGRARPADGPLRDLSKRELEVLALIAEGLTNQEIAGRLVLSEHTVHRHVTNLLRKLGLHSRAAAASLAGRHGLVPQ